MSSDNLGGAVPGKVPIHKDLLVHVPHGFQTPKYATNFPEEIIYVAFSHGDFLRLITSNEQVVGCENPLTLLTSKLFSRALL
jgi:hypothetical protein